MNKPYSPDAARRARPRLRAGGRQLIASALVTAALLVALWGPVAAQASSPTSFQYDSQAQLAQEQAHQAGTADPDHRVIGNLPFTGVDLVLLGVVALALVGAGIALQRMSASTEPDERI